MPTPTQSFIAEHTRGNRKVFDTLDACLFEETKALHENLIAAVTFLHFVDGVSIADQFERLRPKFAALKQKALEWEAARAARKEEFEQRDAADYAQQEAYWAQFYANQDKIARAINRDIARRAQRRDAHAITLPTVQDQPTDSPHEVVDQKTVISDRPTCDICGRTMVRRLNKTKRSWFLACSGYPACKHTRPLADPAETPAENPVDMRRAA